MAAHNKDYAPLMDWHPYVMRSGRAGLRGSTLNTDSLGFRISEAGSITAKVESIDADGGKKGIVLGNSTAFGVNCSNDRAVVASQLIALSGCRWYNMASRAYTLAQELVATTLYPTNDVAWIVSVTGINELTLLLLGGYSEPDDSYFGAPEFRSRMNARQKNLLGRAVLICPKSPPREEQLEIAYNRMIKATRKRLHAYKLLLTSHNANGLILLQPVLGLSKKEMSREEEALSAASDASSDTRSLKVLKPEILGPWYERFNRDFSELCRSLIIDYYNANEFPSLLTADWLFWDRIHLTDTGHAHLAKSIWDLLSKPKP